MKKSDLLALIAADEIQPALDITTRCVAALQWKEMQDEALLLCSQWEGLEKEERTDTVSRETLQQSRNKLKRALITFTRDFPEELPIDAPKRKDKAVVPQAGIEEVQFKRQLFFFMLAAKAWIIYWILFHEASGGFSNGEALATISLLLPAFTAYTSVMLVDLLRQHHRPALPSAYMPRVGRSLQLITWALMLAYVFTLHSIVGSKAAGMLAETPAANFENMTKWLAIVESGLGVYIGLIVGEFFKKEK